MLCKKCGIELNIKNFNKKSMDIKGKRLTLLCGDCAKQIEKQLKEECFVCEYKGGNIYCKDNRYVPYWGCGYYFKTLEDCKKSMNNKHRVVINPYIIDLFNDI